jgi:hypothetical protein
VRKIQSRSALTARGEIVLLTKVLKGLSMQLSLTSQLLASIASHFEEALGHADSGK